MLYLNFCKAFTISSCREKTRNFSLIHFFRFRYSTIWTGDNAADWGHLQSSIKMCLSVSVGGKISLFFFIFNESFLTFPWITTNFYCFFLCSVGVSFCGSDVGGFVHFFVEYFSLL